MLRQGSMPGMAFGGGTRPLSQIMFEKYDADKSGHIDSKEFQQLCFALGYALTPVEIEVAIKVLDTDGSGKVESNEFTAWWKKSDRWESLKLDDAAIEVRQAAAETFNAIDSTKTGKITTSDFDKFHKDLVDRKLTTKDRDACLADLDANGDKSIQFSEYIDWLARIGTISVKVSHVGSAEELKGVSLKSTIGGGAGAGAGAGAAPKMPAAGAAPVVLRQTSSTPKAGAPGPAASAGAGATAGAAPVVLRQTSGVPKAGAAAPKAAAADEKPKMPTLKSTGNLGKLP